MKPDIKKIKDIYGMYEYKLKIPSYQRPYSWQEEQVIALLDDIIEAWEQQKKAYLVGNIIFHQEDNKLHIIDGQQRLITFALMFYDLYNKYETENYDKIDEFLNNELSILSTKALKRNYKIIKERFEYLNKRGKLESFKEYLENSVIVSYLVTSDIDEAFLLFDSQNTRGKALFRKDLLKVHHIRHMQNELQKEISPEMIKFAKLWEQNEKIDEGKSYLGEDDFLEFLFDQVLGVARRATRRELQPKDLHKVDVYKEFQGHGANKKLNNYNQPQLFQSYIYNLEKEVVQYIPKFLSFQSPYMLKGYESLPFEVTQSIAGGSGFFLFTQKYVQLLKKLRKNKYFIMLDDVRGAGNSYLRKIYRALLLYFYDKFEDELFEEFALHLYLLLAYYRANTSSIYVNGVVKFTWGDDEKRFDIFQEILLSYSPEHIVKNIRKFIQYHCQEPKYNDWQNKNFSGTVSDFWKASDPFKEKRDQLLLELWGE